MNNFQPEKQIFSDWLDRFFCSYYNHRPVNATFIGIHDRDHLLPDYSENNVADAVVEMKNLLHESLQFDQKQLTSWEKIDLSLALGFLKIQLWEYQSNHFFRGNPSFYTGEAIFGIMSLFLSEFASFKQRVASAIERLHAIPTLLEQGQRIIKHAPQRWTERAIRECNGALIFLTEGTDLLLATNQIDDTGFKDAANKAAAAFESFKSYLISDVKPSSSDGYACGEEALDLYLQHGHFLNRDALEIVEYAEEELTKAKNYLTDHVTDFNATTSQDVFIALSEIHPTTEQYYDRYQELWNDVRERTEIRDYLTWPDFPIRYVPRPAWAQKAAPFLYFLYYRSPAAFKRPLVHNYFVLPIDRSMPKSEQHRLLKATNDSVIKLNHVIHHGSIGHHIQNWYAFHSASRIGRVAAVDCAARIAMFCGGTMAEGWACYATDLMNEAGFLTPLEQYADHQTRVRMCARAIVDVRLHHGIYTLEQASIYYQQHAGMSEEAALGEAVKNSMFPGTAMMYLIGTDEIHILRKKMATVHGKQFSLKKFHDNFLSYGSIPVSLISNEMIAKKEHDKQ